MEDNELAVSNKENIEESVPAETAKQEQAGNAQDSSTRRNTTKVLENNYFSSDNFDVFTSKKISVSYEVESNYEESFTDDIVLLNERKDTAEKIFAIWEKSPYAKKYGTEEYAIKKIPKKDILEIFYYVKERLEKAKPISAYEMIIGINEFFDFNYDYIVSKVLSPKIKSRLMQDFYSNGMQHRIDKLGAVKLF